MVIAGYKLHLGSGYLLPLTRLTIFLYTLSNTSFFNVSDSIRCCETNGENLRLRVQLPSSPMQYAG